MDLDEAVEVLNRHEYKGRRDWSFIFSTPLPVKPEDVCVRAQYDVKYMGEHPFELTKVEAITAAQALTATAEA